MAVNGYVRQSSGQIVTGQTIQASHFNAEYNAIQTAMDVTSGHTHDGTTGGGQPLSVSSFSGLTSTSAGIVAANGSNALVVRTLTAPAAGLTISNGTGASGNPTFALANDLAAVEALASNGLATRTATDTWAVRTLTGTSNRITVTNGDGVSGNPTVDISSSYVGQATITTLGTITTGTWTGTAIAVANGGTGQTSYTNGQLLIGNSTGNTLSKATLTAPAAGITITNGTGTITFALANDLAAVEGLASNGIATRTGTDTWTVRTMTGTSNRITVTNGDGVGGQPTFDIASSYVGQNTITTLGTITTGTWTGTTIAIANGGTGQTSASAAINALVPTQTGNAGRYLTTNATSVSWADPFASSALTGTPTAPTAATGTNTTQIATTAFVQDAVGSGAVIQSKRSTYTTYSNTSANIPTDNSIPQSGEGLEILTVTITPKLATSTLRVRFSGFGAVGSAAGAVGAVFRDSGADALYAVVQSNSAGFYTNIKGEFEVSASSTSATTFKLRVGANTGTLYLNGDSGARAFGGVGAWYLSVEELKV